MRVWLETPVQILQKWNFHGIPSSASTALDQGQRQQGVKLLSGPFDRSQISSHVIPETAHPHSDPCYNVLLVDLPETPDSAVYAHNVSPVPGSKSD